MEIVASRIDASCVCPHCEIGRIKSRLLVMVQKTIASPRIFPRNSALNTGGERIKLFPRGGHFLPKCSRGSGTKPFCLLSRIRPGLIATASGRRPRELKSRLRQILLSTASQSRGRTASCAGDSAARRLGPIHAIKKIPPPNSESDAAAGAAIRGRIRRTVPDCLAISA